MSYLGEDIKKLGFGLMRLPQLEDGKIDIEQTKQMVDLFLEAGFTYFDTRSLCPLRLFLCAGDWLSEAEGKSCGTPEEPGILPGGAGTLRQRRPHVRRKAL